MENYIVINGKKIELTPEQLKALGIEMKVKNPFEYAEIDRNYYFIESYGAVMKDTLDISQEKHLRCSRLKDIANYCADKDLLQQQAYHETLNRLLWRFSMEHGGDEIVWNDDDEYKYHLYYSHIDKKWCVDWCKHHQIYGACCFVSMDIAEQAIEEIVKPFMVSHPDFKL